MAFPFILRIIVYIFMPAELPGCVQPITVYNTMFQNIILITASILIYMYILVIAGLMFLEKERDMLIACHKADM